MHALETAEFIDLQIFHALADPLTTVNGNEFACFMVTIYVTAVEGIRFLCLVSLLCHTVEEVPPLISIC